MGGAHRQRHHRGGQQAQRRRLAAMHVAGHLAEDDVERPADRGSQRVGDARRVQVMDGLAGQRPGEFDGDRHAQRQRAQRHVEQQVHAGQRDAVQGDLGRVLFGQRKAPRPPERDQDDGADDDAVSGRALRAHFGKQRLGERGANAQRGHGADQRQGGKQGGGRGVLPGVQGGGGHGGGVKLKALGRCAKSKRAWVQPSRAWIHGGGVKHIQGQADHDGAQQALLHPQEPRIAPDPAADTRRAEREAAAIGQAQHLHRDAQHQHLDPHGPVVRRGALRQEGDHEQQHLRVQQIRHEALPEGVAGRMIALMPR
ncbi:hypothetical protein G6F68_010848 [Rhizopus microsporus]|nr:hypothetical protein G6F68_010848 [Rhizopus microsporus]